MRCDGGPGPSQDLPVLVYGRGDDEQPFQEETNVRRLNFRDGLNALATRVAPGQDLILINLATEEDQRCTVAFVGQQHLGRNMKTGLLPLMPPFAASLFCNSLHHKQIWRRRVGVEPTIRPAKDRIAGFEGRGSHRTPFASV